MYSGLYGREFGAGPRFEMFIYVDELDATVDDLRSDMMVLREPADMPWGERVAYVADPDGNPGRVGGFRVTGAGRMTGDAPPQASFAGGAILRRPTSGRSSGEPAVALKLQRRTAGLPAHDLVRVGDHRAALPLRPELAAGRRAATDS